MTKPIFEPTPDRWSAYLDYGEQQLFRRPAPRTGLLSIPWVRLKQLDQGQAWTATEDKRVIYDDVCYSITPDGTEFFDIGFDGFGFITSVHPLVDGLYQATFRAYMDITPTPFPANGFIIVFFGVDWDLYSPYDRFIQGAATNYTGSGYSEIMFRATAANSFFSDWELFVHLKGVGSAFQLQDSGGGTYLEVRYLGAADAPFGLNNQDFECGS